MNYGAIASSISKLVSSLNKEGDNIAEIKFSDNWSSPSSDKLKSNIDEVLSAISKLSGEMEQLIKALQLIADCKKEDEKIAELQSRARSLNYISGKSDQATAAKYQSIMRDISAAKSVKESYLKQAKACLASIGGVSVTTPATVPVIPKADYSDITDDLNSVFLQNNSSSTSTSSSGSSNIGFQAAVIGGAVGTSVSSGGYTSSSGGSSSSQSGPIAITDEKLKKYNSGYAFPIAEGTGYYISSRYGSRRSFKTKAGYTSSFHHGVDIAVKAGTPVHAAMEGEVIACGTDKAAGNYVKIKHPDGKTSIYYHLSSYNVKKGDKVKQGDIIAKVGSTGRATGPHLHFEVRDSNGKSMNPEEYIFV